MKFYLNLSFSLCFSLAISIINVPPKIRLQLDFKNKCNFYLALAVAFKGSQLPALHCHPPLNTDMDSDRHFATSGLPGFRNIPES